MSNNQLFHETLEQPFLHTHSPALETLCTFLGSVIFTLPIVKCCSHMTVGSKLEKAFFYCFERLLQ